MSAGRANTSPAPSRAQSQPRNRSLPMASPRQRRRAFAAKVRESSLLWGVRVAAPLNSGACRAAALARAARGPFQSTFSSPGSIANASSSGLASASKRTAMAQTGASSRLGAYPSSSIVPGT